MYVFDFGANIGCHTIVFSQLVGNTGRVFAYEPQRLIFQSLCGNIAINSINNVYCYQKAISYKVSFSKILDMNPNISSNFGGAFVNETHGIEIETINLDSMSITKCDFIKSDIENMEKEMLEGGILTIKKFRPIMYLEDNSTNKSETLIDILISLNYKLFKHTTPYYNSDNFFNNNDNVFHNLYSFNILCLPREKVREENIINSIDNLKELY